MTTPAEQEVTNLLPLTPDEAIEELQQALDALNRLGRLVNGDIAKARVILRGVIGHGIAAAEGQAAQINNALDAVEQCIRGLSQPRNENTTATELQLAASYGLQYVAALRRALASPPTVPHEPHEFIGLTADEVCYFTLKDPQFCLQPRDAAIHRGRK